MDSTRASRQAGAEERDEAGYDERARRVLNLFFVLNASRSPISTNDIIYDSDLGYNSGNPESDKRKFLRDRNDLARYGIHIVERKENGASEREESSWAIDRSKTDASLTLLTADDADILLAALGEYAEQPHIPYRPALERIQAKLMGAAGSADSRRVLAPHIDGRSDDPVLQALWSAFTLRRQAVFSYKNAQGDVTKKRSVSIWGFFTQDDLVYFVGFDLGRDAVRTFRVDRVTRVYKPSKSYSIPEDFNITDYRCVLSLRDPADKKKYHDDDAMWNHAENALREVLTELGIHFTEEIGEAAFYGPKLDVNVKPAVGAEYTLSTCQLDFCLPAKFHLTYVDKDGSEKTPVVLHRAILGSLDRFMAYLIEETKGKFPTWLAPVQVKVLPVSEKTLEYAESITEKLVEAGVRVALDDDNQKIGYKIRAAQQVDRVPYMLVLGAKEAEAGNLSVRDRKGETTTMEVDEFIAKVTEEIKTRAYNN